MKDTRTEAEKEAIAKDPSKTDETVVLPTDNGAAVLDSDKDADNRGGNKARERRREQRERARTEDQNVEVPKSDAEAQADRRDRRPTREELGEAINERGWATYGDIGYVDADGFLFLSDRRADLILSGGVNLYPQEIEIALAQHEAVDEVAVVGVPHEDFGEQPLAVVVPKPGWEPSAALAQAIVEQAGTQLAKLKRPQRLVFVHNLPRLETGKLLRRVLKERYQHAAEEGFALRSAHT